MPNRLVNEYSPYLLQHAHNPVDWFAWGAEPFEIAKKENKPVLVSIGYAACHWCHVMERESFEDPEVAAYMNRHFINIKVDREEHPEVDHLYMDAVQAISGSGGWPLNVFVMPDRIPFYGGTYFPPRPAFNRLSWLQLLEKINDIWTNQQDEITLQSRQMTEYLKQASGLGFSSDGVEWSMESCRQMAEALLQQADKKYGGFGRAPKFPASMSVSFLLEHYHYTKHEASLDQALLSLDSMTEGGIYDQLGGGFARYATDDHWLAPHFEKMLYDNALLIQSLCDAYYVSKDPMYKRIIEETIGFVERELKGSKGGYYSALDADSEGVEGKFYTWTWDEWLDALGQENDLLESYFGVSKEGNWEHTNILHVAKDINTLAKETSFFKDEIEKKIQEAKKKLFTYREKRIRPLTDDKCLLSWNALMNTALSKAAIALEHQPYLQRAQEHMEWMLQHFKQGEELMHTWKNGVARITANLDDYAYLIQALLQLSSASGEQQWLMMADKLANEAVRDFSHENGSFFYYSSARQNDIPVRKVDLYDGATPSANAVMANNLLVLGTCMGRNDLLEQASFMLRQMASLALKYPSSFSYWALLLQRYAQELKVVVSAGPDADKMRILLQQHFMPHAYLVTSKKEISDISVAKEKFFSGETRIFVCTQQVCKPPVDNLESALDLISL